MRHPLRKILLGLMVALAALFGLPVNASAAQGGLQQIYNPTNGGSGYTVRYNCGDAGLNPGQYGGEGQTLPHCGATSSAREPAYVWVGPGWCISRSIYVQNDGTTSWGSYGTQNIAAGGSGIWVKLWQSWVVGGNSYTNTVRSWSGTGSGCPTSGPAFADANTAYFEWR